MKLFGVLALGSLLFTSCQNVRTIGTTAQGGEADARPLRLGLDASYERDKAEVEGGSSVETDTVLVDVEGGYRLAPHVELGAIVSLLSQRSDDVGDADALAMGPSARLYFVDEGKVQPWVGIAVGIASVDFDGDSSENGTFFRGGLGVSYFATSSVAIEGGLSYQRIGLDEVDLDTTMFAVGISTFF